MYTFSSFMIVALDYNGWIDLLEDLLNFKSEILKRAIFNVYDYNEDKSICNLDLFAIMQLYENDEEVFINSISHDLCKIVEGLYKK